MVSVTQIHGGDTWNVIPETVARCRANSISRRGVLWVFLVNTRRITTRRPIRRYIDSPGDPVPPPEPHFPDLVHRSSLTACTSLTMRTKLARTFSARASSSTFTSAFKKANDHVTV